jgi:hypothetical protein
VGDGQKTAAEVAPQGSNRRGRRARLRALNLRNRNIEAATNDAVVMNFNALKEMDTITPSLPTS